MSTRIPTALCLSLLLACDPTPPAGDAGAPDGSTSSGLAMIPWRALGEPPIAPVLLTPCPEGWRETSSADAITLCEPEPVGGRPTCGADEAFFPGTPGCVLVGSTCPSDGLPTGLPAGRPAHFVLAGAAAGGDGSHDAPFDTIEAAIAVAGSGDVVAIGRGVYDGHFVVPRGVTLQGACVHDTVLVSSTTAMNQGVVDVAGTDVEVRNLRIGRSARWGLVVPPSGRSALVEDVIVEGTTGLGITAAGSRVELRRVAIRDVTAGSRAPGYGIDVEVGGTLVAQWLVVERATQTGILASGDGSSFEVRDVMVLATSRAADGAGGTALAVQRGASGVAERALLAEASEVAVFVDIGAVTLHDVVVRDVAPVASGSSGRALYVQAASHAEVRRMLVERASEVGLGASGDAAVIDAEDVVVRDMTGTRQTAGYGIGLLSQHGAHLDVRRATLLRTRSAAIFVGGGASMTATDLRIDDVDFDGESDTARGLGVQGGVVTAQRVSVRRTREISIGAYEVGTTVEIEDLLVDDPIPSATFEAGTGVLAYGGAAITLRRAWIAETLNFGVASMASGETLSSVDLEDVVIENTARAGCAATSCPGSPGGMGVVVVHSPIVARRFEIHGAALCGLYLADQPAFTLELGRVEGSEVGVCLVRTLPDLAVLAASIDLSGNGMALGSTELPPPTPAAALSGL